MTSTADHSSHEVEFKTAQNERVQGTFTKPAGKIGGAALLLHGCGGVDRNEYGGVFEPLVAQLAQDGIASLRYDNHTFTHSQSQSVDLTLAELAAEIEAGSQLLRSLASVEGISVVAVSFSGGVAAQWVSRNQQIVDSLVLINPSLNYRGRLLEQKPWWKDNAITPDGLVELERIGYFEHGSNMVRIRQNLIDEVLAFDAEVVMKDLTVPTLTIHGTEDSMIPYEWSKALYKTSGVSELVTIEGADHGMLVPGHEDYSDPRSQQWLAQALAACRDWLKTHRQRSQPGA